MSTNVGDYVLLLPEDVPALTDSAVYAEVASVQGDRVNLRVIGGQLMRDPGDATSSWLGLWLRKAVCFGLRGSIYYGQVSSYDDNGLNVCTQARAKHIDASSIWSEVYPVVALIL
ncbi:hypothetical protein PHMEG_00034320, partial [Phytophthora megakarya]